MDEKSTPPAGQSSATEADKYSAEGEFWYSRIDEKAAAQFLDLSTRTMQGFRQKGGGPVFIALSPRCIRYTRTDLRNWCNDHLRSSTSDAGAPTSPDSGKASYGLPARAHGRNIGGARGMRGKANKKGRSKGAYRDFVMHERYIMRSVTAKSEMSQASKALGTSLVSLKQAQIDWLLCQGVKLTAISQTSPIMTCCGERASDGRFDENHEGPQWLVFEEQYDLVFWNPATGEIATDSGRAFALGEEAIDNPATTAFERWLYIYADPLAWLRNDRRGIVVLKWQFSFEKLRDVPRIAVVEAMLPTYRKMMKPLRIPRLAVLPKSERTVA